MRKYQKKLGVKYLVRARILLYIRGWFCIFILETNIANIKWGYGSDN